MMDIIKMTIEQALEFTVNHTRGSTFSPSSWDAKTAMLVMAKEIESLRQQLAEKTSGEPVAYADVKFQHDKRWPPGISLHFIGGTGFGDLGKLGHGIHNLYANPPSVEVLLEALRLVKDRNDKALKDGRIDHMVSNALATYLKNVPIDALNAYSSKPKKHLDN
jgi:hypothetical protein